VKREDWRYRGQVRFAFPLTDLLFAYFGFTGALLGVGSVQEAAGDEWQLVWSAGIGVAALVAFIGVAFPKLWAVELGGKIMLVALVAPYIVLYAARGIADPHVTAIAGLEIILIIFPIWRIGDLGFESWLRGYGKGARREGDTL
jgi:hypothetical protein